MTYTVLPVTVLAVLYVAPPLLLRGQQNAGNLAPEAVLTRMEERNRLQQSSLPEWTSIRLYTAGNNRLGKWAKASVQVISSAEGEKTFRVMEHQGSAYLLKHVIQPVLEAERVSAQKGIRELTEISRQNYEFRQAGFDEEAFVFEATPRKPHRYQFQGRIWVDARTFAIRRVEGMPAVPPSFWVKRTDFAREYRQYGQFWLPAEHHSRAQVRIVGDSMLQIDYGTYGMPR